MPQSGMSDDQLKRYFDRQDFDPANLTPDEKLRLKTLTEPAAPVTSNAPADDSPIAFARGVGRGAWNQGKTILSGMRDVGSAAWDVGRAAMQDPMLGGSREAARPENAGPGESTIVPMLKGFGSGVVEGAKNLVDPAKWAENQEGFTGVKIAGDQPLSEKLGASAVNITAILGPAKLAGRGMRALRGGGAAAEAPILETASKLGTRTATAEGAGSARSGTAFHPGDLPQAPAYKGAAGVGHEVVPPESGVTGAGGRRPPTPPQGPAAPPAGPSTGVGAPPDRGLGAVTEQDRIFEALMDDLHPESEGPLPGNGELSDDIDGGAGVSIDPQNVGAAQYFRGGARESRVPGGTYWTPNRDIAQEYATNNKGTVHDLHPDEAGKVKNPVVIDFGADGEQMVREARKELGLKGGGQDINLDMEEALPAFARRGHDAVVIKGMPTPDGLSGDELVMLNSEPTLSDLRNSKGAASAAQDPRLRSLESEVGVPMNKDAVRDITGTPSRVPDEVSNRTLDDDFWRHIMDERGSVSIFPGDDKPNANPKTEAAGDVRKDLAGKRDFSEGLDPARYRFRLWPKDHFDKAGLKTESSVPPASGAKDDISKALDDYAKKVADIKTQEEATKPLPKINLREEPSAADKKSFLGKYGDETGSFSPKALLDGANQLRVASFLSGLAIPKSILGNAGAIATAAIEGGTTKPIRAMGDIRTNFANLKKNWKASANPGAISGAGKLNPPGRIMGAVDQTTQELLERAGVPEDEARRLLLTRNNNAFKELGLSGRAGRAFFPFQRTASNVIKEGFSGENWKGPTRGGSARRTALSLGAMGAGSVLGSNTNDPKILGLAAALAGPRAVPMLIAAAMGGAGKNAVAGLSPIPEWGLPSKPSDLLRLTGIEPAAVRAFGLNTQTGRKGRDDKKTTNRTRKERK